MWARFRAAQDAFFARRSGTFAERDAEQVANQHKKEEVIARAAALDVSDPKAAQSALRDLQAQLRRDRSRAARRDAPARRPDAGRGDPGPRRRRGAVAARPARRPTRSWPRLRDRLAEAEAKLERARKSGDAARIAKAEQEVEQRSALIPSD